MACAREFKLPIYIGMAMNFIDPEKESYEFECEESKECTGDIQVIEPNNRPCRYAIYLHDGFYTVDCSLRSCPTSEDFNMSLIQEIERLSNPYKVVLVGIHDDMF